LSGVCEHGHTSVITSNGRITTGICEKCNQPVDLSVLIHSDGRCFWWKDGAPEQRGESHPANVGWLQVAPRVWVNPKTAIK
jgi:hypothetical protein